MSSPSRHSLVEAIAREEMLLEELIVERQRVEQRLRELRATLSEIDGLCYEVITPTPLQVSEGPEWNPDEKIRLFRSLFRGREDVYPKLWINAKTGRKGYSPACSSEWARGICEKPRVKCGECPSQAFLPVTDQVVRDHLQGRHVIGVHPLLPDETCWFLAADFDKASWQDDVAAFLETCRHADIPVSIERSRSGNGAHAWFFFSSPVPATTARKMGCYLLTQTMSRHHQLSLESYDRLFPNQDTMPKGGFGNLIALPLQHQPRQLANTVFLDDRFEPHPDQWSFLASIRTLELPIVEALAEEASRQGQVIGVPLDIDAGDEQSPWERRPSRRPRALVITEPLPDHVQAVLGQRVFLEKAGLPSPLLNQIKRLAAFQNPEFYKKQSLRLSTALTPRVILCAEEHADHIALPRGCLDDLAALLQGHGVALNLTDERRASSSTPLRFQGELSAVQQDAAAALLQHDIGILVAPPGAGKTVIGTFLIASRSCSTLVLVHRRPLMDQWLSQLQLFLGVPPSDVGRIGAGRSKATGLLDVAMIQSLIRKGQVDDRVGAYDQVIVDECHHVPAVSFTNVLSEVKARFIAGLTATPQRRDGLQRIAHMQLGPIRHTIDPSRQVGAHPFDLQLVVRETHFDAAGLRTSATVQEVYSELIRDPARNTLIVDDVRAAIREGRSPILLTERTEHLDFFVDQLQDDVRHLVVLRGGMSNKKRQETLTRLQAIPDDEERLIVATGRYIGEGFDDARLDTLFLAMPVSWKGTLVQYAGRLHRKHPGKSLVRIIDYADRKVPMLERMFQNRRRGYRSLGYARDETLKEPVSS